MGCGCGAPKYRGAAAAAKKVKLPPKPSPVPAGQQVVAQTAQRMKRVHGYKIRRNPV